VAGDPVRRPVAEARSTARKTAKGKKKTIKKASARAAVPAPKRIPAGRLERIMRDKGYRSVAGVDEVGRGALAGPLVVAAVLLDLENVPTDLCDSKMLEPEERETCAAVVLRVALAVSYVVVDPEDIDDDGLGVSNIAALQRAVSALRPWPEYVISDHFSLDETGLPHVGLPRADAMSAAVAAASIVAKVHRDAFMTGLDATYPGYHFASNKGYGTAEHWAAIRALGPSEVHRRSFRGVASYQPSFGDL
jgi:ribonuclease HII